jgi:hypothetical protein
VPFQTKQERHCKPKLSVDFPEVISQSIHSGDQTAVSEINKPRERSDHTGKRTGRKTQKDEEKKNGNGYLHRGIACRAFEAALASPIT